MIHISSSIVLAQAGETINANNPRIGYRSIVTASNVSADEEADDEPVTNLANPATYLYWRGTSTSAQAVTVSLEAAADVDYFAIAKHNLGSTGATVAFQSSADGETWTTIETIEPSSDYALIVEFDSVTAQFYRLSITPGTEPPAIAVLYIGEILVLQRRLFVNHTPLVYGRKTTVSSGMSESGQFLGRVVRRQLYSSSVTMGNLTSAWYRSHLDPFFEAARTKPYFWAWRPAQYPHEVGFAWMNGDPSMTNQRANGMIQIEFSMSGVR